jgi:hypothetical protein
MFINDPCHWSNGTTPVGTGPLSCFTGAALAVVAGACALWSIELVSEFDFRFELFVMVFFHPINFAL